MAPVQQTANSAATLQGTSSTESDFVFKEGIFYVTFDGHVHSRKSAPELYEHLSYVPPPPVMNDNGKRMWSDSVDSYVNYPAHFYAAQLLHYGLKPLKTKAAARKKLLEAFSGPDGRTLEVPQSILDLEARLRKRYRSNPAAMDVVQDLPDAQMDRNTPDLSKPTTSLTKRPRTKQTAKKTTTPTVVQKIATVQLSSKDSEPALSKHVPAGQPASSSKTDPRTKKTAAKINYPMAPPLEMSYNSPPPKGSHTSAQASTSTKGPRTKQTARKTTGGKPSQKSSSSSKLSEPRAAVKRFEKLQPDEVTYEIESYADSCGSVHPAKEMVSPEIPNLMAKEKPADPSEWLGVYDIEAPSLDDESESGKSLYSFEIYPSSTSTHLWASFDFGSFTGVMRSIHPVPKFFNTEIFFEWRGHITDDSMSFDEDNRAIITLHPGGLLKGEMFASVHGTYHIYGCRPARPVKTLPRKQQLGKVKSWKFAWRSINNHNYEVANTVRWGKYGGEEKEEEAFLSDTTNGKRKRASKIDLENFMSEAYSSGEDSEMGEDDEDEDEGEHGW